MNSISILFRFTINFANAVDYIPHPAFHEQKVISPHIYTFFCPEMVFWACVLIMILYVHLKNKKKEKSMKYSMGECLGEYGFRFYEKLHEPIFLLSRLGRIIKMNEAGRKLISIAQLKNQEIENQLLRHLKIFFDETTLLGNKPISSKTTVINSRNRKLHLTTCLLPNSDFVLIELRR